jgi:hypothetical protein
MQSSAAAEVSAHKAVSAESAISAALQRLPGAALGDGQARHDQQRGGGHGDAGYGRLGPGLTGQIADALGGKVSGQDEERHADEPDCADFPVLSGAA